jgi:septum site-determining protein MinC
LLPDALPLPKIRVRGRSFLALMVAPEPPLERWFEALDEHMARSAAFFAGQPVVADLTGVADKAALAVLEALDGLFARGLRVVGVEGVEARRLSGTRWQGLPAMRNGRDVALERKVDEPEPTPAAPSAAPAQPPPKSPRPSLLIEEPVRSGQSIVFRDGDVTIVGPVASGAEVIAGGSIHVYGPLRGRAIAGARTGGSARIFCRKLEAELVAVAGLYKTADNWGAHVHGRAAQIHRDHDALIVSAFD